MEYIIRSPEFASPFRIDAGYLSAHAAVYSGLPLDPEEVYGGMGIEVQSNPDALFDDGTGRIATYKSDGEMIPQEFYRDVLAESLEYVRKEEAEESEMILEEILPELFEDVILTP